MLDRLTADLVVALHFAFICFVVVGGFIALRWRWVAFLHIPAAVWGALIEFQGWICPLTPLEQRFRLAAGQAGYAGGFIEHYLLPIIYPSGLTRSVQIVLGSVVLAINLVAYCLLVVRVARAGEPAQ